MKQIASRIIWFKPAEKALADPVRFLNLSQQIFQFLALWLVQSATWQARQCLTKRQQRQRR